MILILSLSKDEDHSPGVNAIPLADAAPGANAPYFAYRAATGS
jgi:hypothetical protein